MGFELPSDTLNAAMQALRARHIIRNAQQEVFDLQIAPALSRLDSGLREALDVEQFLNQRHQKYLSSGNDA